MLKSIVTFLETCLSWLLNLWHRHMYSVISFILLVAAFVFLLIFLPKPGNYYDYEKVCPQLSMFTEEFCEELVDQSAAALKKTTLHLMYDRDTGVAVFDFPMIYRAATCIPGVRRVFTAVCPVRSEQQITRYAANDLLRCVIPLHVSAGNQTAVVVDDEIKFIKPGKMIVYDASHPNRIFNKQKRREAVLLIIDIQRPASIPLGTAKLDKSAQYFAPFTAIT